MTPLARHCNILPTKRRVRRTGIGPTSGKSKDSGEAMQGLRETGLEKKGKEVRLWAGKEARKRRREEGRESIGLNSSGKGCRRSDVGPKWIRRKMSREGKGRE